MKFKHEGLEVELEDAHPTLQAVLEELDDWSDEERLPEPMVTCINRSQAENAAVNGVANSWHLCGCAADLRIKHYSAKQKAAVWAWLLRRCPKEKFELIEHNVSTGPHFHIAVRDSSWRLTFDRRPAHA